MKRAAIVALTICTALILGSVAMGIVGIWTEDHRWGDTGFIVGFTAFITGMIILAAAAIASDKDFP